MHTYFQINGVIADPSGNVEGQGYSGQPPYTNDPGAEQIEGKGPIPRGLWHMKELIAQHPTLGPDVIVLEPDADTRAYVIGLGRDPNSFRVHGERLEPPPGFASDGCIIADRDVRVGKLWQSPDHDIQVV
jgi:Protein of unknown function (DUF2778)